ncbi:hypothetical protein PoB_002010400 [Plakobranchus ocellatus]|uniref:Uncharacterized protein n=1 Tax=Plakobranchus ocellatus TaxID=259542 RepID=A0AAV3ZE02_9GAST|nr:hypothetical protein PoB_002010400 [Plakobranchus ocellatus]
METRLFNASPGNLQDSKGKQEDKLRMRSRKLKIYEWCIKQEFTELRPLSSSHQSLTGPLTDVRQDVQDRSMPSTLSGQFVRVPVHMPLKFLNTSPSLKAGMHRWGSSLN